MNKNPIQSFISEICPFGGDSFDFAHKILYLKEKNSIESFPKNFMYVLRDEIFNNVLSEFESKPVRIFQAGAIETFKGLRWRIDSGWSDLIWGEYIKNNGGKLTVVDINIDHLANSVFAATQLGYEINAVHGDATDFISDEPYDIYYLDGGNDPQETLDQFNKIKDTDSIVLIDDYFVKGTLIETEDYDITTYDICNGVSVIDLRAP
tara:strand:+ start:1419 stop:2039 length:621 start_codon:yes stop_codon:yes gene_type:complete